MFPSERGADLASFAGFTRCARRGRPALRGLPKAIAQTLGNPLKPECSTAGFGWAHVRTLGIAVVVLVGCTGPTVDIVGEANATTISQIDRGVLFVDASWSIPSLRARGALETRIEDLPIQLVIADIDRSPALSSVPALADKLTGAGESIWVRNGTICFVCTHADCLEDGLATVFPSEPLKNLGSC